MVEYQVVFIEVTWPWLIYTATLVVCAGVLLALTMWLTHGRDKMAWKSSSLALLFHPLPSDRTDASLLSLADMETEAGDMAAKLSKGEAGGVKMNVS